MASININNWDIKSRQTINQAMELANQFWRSIREDKELRIDHGNPSRMMFRYNGVDHEVHLVIDGALLSAARTITGSTDMIMFRCHFRLWEIKNPNDNTLSDDAKNALFVNLSSGDRYNIEDLTGELIHELTHKQQEINSWLGWISFGIAYLLTLGMVYEPEARRLQREAVRFALKIINARVTVSLSGPGSLYEGQQGTYIATGAPAGGTFTFDIKVNQARDGIRCIGASSDRVTVEAIDDHGVAIINVTYVLGGDTATDSVRIRLCKPS